jgi:hypothetical protein
VAAVWRGFPRVAAEQPRRHRARWLAFDLQIQREFAGRLRLVLGSESAYRISAQIRGTYDEGYGVRSYRLDYPTAKGSFDERLEAGLGFRFPFGDHRAEWRARYFEGLVAREMPVQVSQDVNISFNAPSSYPLEERRSRELMTGIALIW